MKASIIIPCRHAGEALEALLAALARQKQELIEEVIIVENGSSFIDPSRLPQVSYLWLKKGNRSLARNTGAKAAKASVLIFFDVDVIPDECWVERVLQELRDGADVVTTPIVPAAAKLDILQRYRLYRGLSRSEGTFISLKKKDQQSMVINSAAFAIRKEVFESLGGFDPSLYRHEDLDLTQRLLRTQSFIVALSSVRCHVFFHGNLRDYLRREFEQGLERVRYYEKWDKKSWRGSTILFSYIFAWVKSLRKVPVQSKRERLETLLALCSILGNVAGVARKLFFPYPGPKMEELSHKARIEYK